VDLFDRLKGVFSREICIRAINYDKRNLEIKVDADVNGTKFSLADFKTEVEKIREASEFSELLDNYQYQMCRFCQALGRADPEWKKYNKIRVGIFHILTSLQATLIAYQNDPLSQRSRLYDIVGDIQKYLFLVAREIMPSIESLDTKSYVSKGDFPEMSSRTVSKALDIAGLNDDTVDKFLEEFKST
jgi:hypothetical protein